MRDRRLAPVAKSIYALLRSYSGTKGECCPSVERMCYELSIVRSTFYRHIKSLIDAGYITVEKAKGGKFVHNTYRICKTVGNEQENKPLCDNNESATFEISADEKAICEKTVYAKTVYAKTVYAKTVCEKSVYQKSNTKNNILKNNIIKNNNNKNIIFKKRESKNISLPQKPEGVLDFLEMQGKYG